MADVTVANTAPGIAGKTLACHDADGLTTGIWTFANALALKSASGSQIWRVSVGGTGNLNILADGTGNGLAMDTSGSGVFNHDLYEKNRSIPIGHWINVPYNAANFSAPGGMTVTVAAGDVSTYAYTLIGKTLTFVVFLGSLTLGGTAQNEIQVALPAGLSVNALSGVAVWLNPIIALAVVHAGVPYVSIHKPDLSAWGLGTIGPLTFTITCPIA